MQTVRVKVYGFLRPCPPEYLPQLRASLRLLGDAADGVLELGGELLNIAYEGAFFPLDDFMAALSPLLRPESLGKVDYLDIEAWEITRLNFENGFVTRATRDLNSALAHSGH